MSAIPPVPYQTPISSGKSGLLTNPWAAWFRQLLNNIQTTTLTNPMSAIGDLIFGGNSGAPTRLPGSTSATKKFLTQTGNGSDSAQPAWASLISADIPNNAANTTGSAGSLSQSLTQFQLVMGQGAGAGVGSLGSIGTLGQFLQSLGAGIAPAWVNNPAALVIYGTRSAPVLITAAGGITSEPDKRQLIRIKGNGGAITITASVAISPGVTDGQELILEGSSASSPVTINNGTGLEQGGTMQLGIGDKIAYTWNAGASLWTELYRFYAGITGGILTDDFGNPLTDSHGNPLTP